jgi:ABC-type branched-subunit amino acid transport system substrate-binding protein
MKVRMTRARAAVCLFIAAGAVNAAPLTAPEQRGRQIYLHGASDAGRAITAVIGQGETTELAASALPCGSCHGPEGKGVPEGTIEPADIRWRTLTNILVASGRRRPRYDDSLLARALTTGRDAGDQQLSPIMPRYRMNGADLADLVAYLRRLGDPAQPGLDDTSLTIATLIPLSGPRAAIGEATRDTMESYLADVNARGGLHGRVLKLEALDSAAAGATQRVSAALAGDGIFALVCASFAEVDPGVATIVDRERIPVVTPFPSYLSSSATAPSSFFLFPDLASQALALTKQLEPGPRQVVILHDSTAVARTAAAAIEERAPSLQWTIRKDLPDTGRSDDDLVFLLGIDPDDVLPRLEALHWRPQILIAGASLRDVPTTAPSIRIAAPTLPNDLTPEGRQELRAFLDRHTLPSTHIATRAATYATTRTFLEALKRAGRDLTREKLIATLETLYQFPTGLTRPITWARNRHVGTLGAYILTVDADRGALVPVGGGWVGGE